MNYIEVNTYEELSRKAANIIAAQVNLKPECVLGLATGGTPVGTYKRLIDMNKNGDVDFSKVTSVNLDEYVGLDGSNDQSYRYFMNDNLFNHVNIHKEATYVPDGKAADLVKEGERYDNLVEKFGGVDLQLLGIGHNGHIGFNEPAERFVKETHPVELDKRTIEANTRFFSSEADVPRRAITMGMGIIMNAKKVLLIANGSAKKDIIKKSFFGPITPEVPASILQLHKDLTVICCFND